MTPRQRVWATFAHQETDRLPVDLMGTASGLEDRAYFALRDFLGLQGEGRVFRRGWNVSYYDERILEKLNIDFRRVWMRQPVNFQPVQIEENIEIDEWGMMVKRDENASWFVNEPLAGATVGDLESYPWPDPWDPGRIEGLAEEARFLFEKTNYAISARQPTHGIFETAQRMRGTERFLVDLALDKKFAAALVNKLNELRMAFYDAYLDATGPYLQMVESADDYGSQNGPLISPKTFVEIFLPAFKELHQLIKWKAPQAKIFMHSDGAVSKLIPYFIESGVEILNPVEPDVPGNDPVQLKGKYGSELIFHGHLNNKGPMRGSIEEVHSEIDRIKKTIAVGGGYIFAPTNHFQIDVPPENIVEAYRYMISGTE
jgi:uroporphyrinogen decarboxylase